MARRATLRASDADRERIVERLRHAAAEGRLLAEELEERLGRAFAARTYGELDVLVADLPGQVQRRPTGPVRRWVVPTLGLAVAGALVIAVLAAVILIVAGIAMAWGVWLLLAWWLFGHRHHRYAHRHHHHHHHRSALPPRGWADRPSAGPGSWR